MSLVASSNRLHKNIKIGSTKVVFLPLELPVKKGSWMHICINLLEWQQLFIVCFKWVFKSSQKKFVICWGSWVCLAGAQILVMASSEAPV